MSFKLIKNYLLLLTITSVVLFSCSDDDDEGPGDISGSLIGEWSATSAELSEFTVNGQDFQAFLISIGVPSSEIDATEDLFEQEILSEFQFDITFNEGGTYLLEDMEGSETGTWELISNNTKVLLNKGTQDEVELDISELTDSKLVLTESGTDSVDIDDDGTDEVLSIAISLTFTK